MRNTNKCAYIASCCVFLSIAFIADCGPSQGTGGGPTDKQPDSPPGEQAEFKSSLFDAVRSDSTAKVNEALKAGHSINATDNKGYTVLHVAHSADMVRFLLDKGANINALGTNPVKDGVSRVVTVPLYDQALNNRKEIVELLLAKGADPNLGEWPVLFVAISNDDQELIKKLVKAGALLSREDASLQFNSMTHAVHKGKASMVTLIHQLDNSLINVKAPQYPLAMAVKAQDLPLVKSLVGLGADLKTRDYFALAMAKNLEIAKYLHAQGADIKDNVFDGVVDNGHLDGAKLILSLKPSISIKPNYLKAAVKKSHVDIALLLLAHDINLTGLETDILAPKSALEIAIDGGLDVVIKAIIDKEKGKGKNTSLLLGKYWTDGQALTALLKNGVPPSGIAKSDMPLLHYLALNATYNYLSPTVNLLVQHGADINQQLTVAGSLYNDSPLHLAAYNGNKDLAEFLLNNGAKPSLSKLNSNKGTPLHELAARSNGVVGAQDADRLLETAQLLIQQGADKTLKNAANKTAWELINFSNLKYSDYQALLQ